MENQFVIYTANKQQPLSIPDPQSEIVLPISAFDPSSLSYYKPEYTSSKQSETVIQTPAQNTTPVQQVPTATEIKLPYQEPTLPPDLEVDISDTPTISPYQMVYSNLPDLLVEKKPTIPGPIKKDNSTVFPKTKTSLNVGHMQEVIDKFNEHGIDFKITSGLREGATTKSGNQS